MLEEIKSWKPLDKMESITEEELTHRVIVAHSVKMPNYTLTPIPYVGVQGEKVEYSSKELIALCPVTLLPDVYEVSFIYIPRQVIPELKSLKLYLTDYLTLPISHEHLASRLYLDFLTQVMPVKLKVLLKVNIRGGITTTIEIGEI